MLKTLVVIDNLKIGGIATSLYNFLDYACDKMCIELLVFDPDSIDYKRLPEQITVLKSPKLLKMLGMSQKDIKDYSVKLYIYRAVLVILARFFGGSFSRKFIFSSFDKIEGYDVAISYAHDDPCKALTKGCNDFVLHKVSAKYKIDFIHCDYKNFGLYEANQEKTYSQFNQIMCVSESCRRSFIEVFPQLIDKVGVCENFINTKEILKKASNPVCYSYKGYEVVFVTVCRLSEEKGLDRVIYALKRLEEGGVGKFKWVIVGDGPEASRLKTLVTKNQLNGKIQFVGEKDNPYVYIKNADLFILPSIHEAAPMVFGECAVLNVPILTTETCSAKELVAKRGLGMVCDNNDEGIYHALKDVLSKKVMLSKQNDEFAININAKQQFDKLMEKIMMRE